MSILAQRIAAELPSGMEFPAALATLLDWCERQGWGHELDGLSPWVNPYPSDACVTHAEFTNEGTMGLALNLGLADDDRDDAFEERLSVLPHRHRRYAGCVVAER